MNEQTNPGAQAAAAEAATNEDEVIVTTQGEDGEVLVADGSQDGQSPPSEDLEEKPDDLADDLDQQPADKKSVPEFADAAAFVQEANEFAQIFQEIRRKNLEELAQMVEASKGIPLKPEQMQRMIWDVDNIVENIDLLDQAYQDFRGDQDATLAYGLLVSLRSDLLKLKQEVLAGMDPVGLLKATSNENLDETIDSGVASGHITPEEAEKVKTRLQQVQEFAGMTLDGFIALNEGSSLDTFLEFLLNPTGTKGKDGQNLKFGKSEAYSGAELMPLMVFRSKFDNPAEVAKALKTCAEQVDSSWAVDHRSELQDAAETGDVEKTIVVMQKMFQELMVNNDSREEKQKLFRLHFATALDKKTDGQSFMDDASFTYFAENVKDKEKMDKLWKVSSD